MRSEILLRSVILVTMCGVTSVKAQHRPNRNEQLRSAVETRTNRPIFVFQTDEFWLNLHHFLYVLGRAQNHTRDASRAAVAGAPAEADKLLATLTEADQKIW